ncbi:divergent polysaccharide deacetylase family protein [Pseudodesulfovibrio cashew]|uniref:Divergent polysaccharide deacetylase family protein n=1 Tax=Pseudodesulfovibrio cashew TaxID=2678688 RepID=A0A6I6JJM1_9BACT|nr:divergent polysaccharide deacetylase family protein [Pseudodesulfovibrio cashew]QGY41168.1 divergent polysaccharide deacetylase family protein [Pseudodesulfovibrio cashew]
MDERSQEEKETERTGLDRLLSSLYRPGPLIFLFTLAFAALAGLGYFLLTEETPPPVVVVEEAPAPAEAPRIYEEDTSSDMEDMVKQADLAIIETMKAMDLGLNQMDLLDVEIRRLEGKGYHYQVLQLPAVPNHSLFLKNLKTNLASRLPQAVVEPSAKNELALFINGLPTHRLLLESVPLALPRPEPEGPELAVVIDDIGENLPILKGLLSLDFPVTLAVWPNATHTRESAELVTENRHDLLIHFPMEPQGYPEYDPGDDALFVKMSPEQIRQRVALNVARIPEAIGVNNHMGSRFTTDAPGMKVALAEFKRNGLFFLDSMTTGKSVGRTTAKEAHIPYYERDIFIDNVKDVNAIILQLKKAENVAHKQGHAIAIGHPHRQTLDALRQWGQTRNKAIRLVYLSKMAPQ